MTETEWLACTDPEQMLEFVQQQQVAESIGISEEMRKERLFGCACCWQVKDLMVEAGCWEAVAVAERLADDLADADDQEKFFWLTHEIAEEHQEKYGDQAAPFLAACLSNLLFEESSEIASLAYGYLLDLTSEDLFLRRAWGKQAVHCIWGLLPFRPLPPRRGKRRWEQEKKHWLAWHDGTIRKLARTIYEERVFDRLPILGDALEEAGCDNTNMLDHCHQPGGHVRGCWLIDLLREKE